MFKDARNSWNKWAGPFPKPKMPSRKRRKQGRWGHQCRCSMKNAVKKADMKQFANTTAAFVPIAVPVICFHMRSPKMKVEVDRINKRVDRTASPDTGWLGNMLAFKRFQTCSHAIAPSSHEIFVYMETTSTTKGMLAVVTGSHPSGTPCRPSRMESISRIKSGMSFK